MRWVEKGSKKWQPENLRKSAVSGRAFRMGKGRKVDRSAKRDASYEVERRAPSGRGGRGPEFLHYGQGQHGLAAVTGTGVTGSSIGCGSLHERR